MTRRSGERAAATSRIQPGGTLAVLGGGPDGGMIAAAARAMGYRVAMLDPHPSAAAAGVADRVIERPLTDLRAVADLARDADVVTTAVEELPVLTAETAALFAPMRPGASVIGIAQDRAREREWLEARQLSLGRWCEAASLEALEHAMGAFGGACYVKPRRRTAAAMRPHLVTGRSEAAAAWTALGPQPCVVEEVLPIDLELSVVVARTPLGATAAYPTVVSYRAHAEHAWSVLPGGLPAPLDAKAQGLATFVAGRIGLEGLFAVEMFLLHDGRLVVNEIVPCPHPTYLGAEVACVTGQPEQLVRAVCGLPLGSTAVVQPTATTRIPGELWHGGPPPLEDVLRLPGTRLRLFDWREPQIGQWAGYLCATADSAEEAVRRVMLAKAQLYHDRSRRAIVRRVPGLNTVRRHLPVPA